MKLAARLIIAFLAALSLWPFQPRLAGQTVVTLHTFAGADGAVPFGTLTPDGNGNFYGTTFYGGSNNNGTIFTITPSGTLTTPYHFSALDQNASNADGANPRCGLLRGSDGDFYGTTSNGGSGGSGAIYKISPAGVFTPLNSFTGASGVSPNGALIQRNGTFYGTTVTTTSGGGHGYGTVYTMSPLGVLSTLVTFDLVHGAFPLSALILGSDDKFYGTTDGGGNGAGTIFSLTPAGDLTTLHVCASDAYPNPALVQGSNGTFYGVTVGASYNDGAIYSITTAGVYTSLHSFNGTDGSQPESELIFGSDGKLYGTTKEGGSNGAGTIFSMTPAGAFTTLYNFNGVDGRNPFGALAQGSGGNFYGTTRYGGNTDKGIVFRLSLAPEITSASTASGKVGTQFSYQTIATNRPTSYSAIGLPNGLTVGASTGLISGTPTAAGASAVTLVASNAIGIGSATLHVTINPAVPVITSTATPSGQVGLAYNYQITATNNPTSYAASGLPPGLAVSPASGLVSGTPSQAGTFMVGVSAANAGSTSATKNFSLTILPAVPVITSAASASGQVGQAFSYRITASNNPTAFGASGLPAGLTVNQTTGVISGTPTAPTAVGNPANATITASNGGEPGSATLTLTITSGASSVPVITSAANVTGQVNVLFGYQIAASNNPASYGASGLPAGLSVDAAGYISGTPTAAGDFYPSLSATNTSGTGTATLTLGVSAAPADSFNFASPPAGSRLVGGRTIPVYVSVEFGSGTLQKLTVTANNAPLVETNAGINEFQWTTPSVTQETDYTLGAAATNSSGQTNTFTLHVTVVPAPDSNPVSTIQLLPDVSEKRFIPGTDVNLVPVAALAGGGIKTVGVYDSRNNPIGGLLDTPLCIFGTNRIFQSFPYKTKATVARTTATATYANNCSNPSTAVSIVPTTAQLDKDALTCAITGLTLDANGSVKVQSGQPLTVTANARRKIGSNTANASLVEYYLDGTKVGESASAPYNVTVPASALGAGQHTLTAIATDTVLASEGVSVQAAKVNLLVGQPPVITSATAASAAVGKAFSYQIAATNNPTKYGESGHLPNGVTLNTTTGRISGTPTESGTFPVTLGAFNAIGSDLSPLTLTVNPPAPVFNSATTATARVGSAFAYQITATNSPASYATSSIPPGLSFSTGTGKFTGTPTKAGTYKPLLSATNAGGTASANLNLTVKEAIPEIDSALTAGAQVGVAFSYQASATNSPVSFAISSLAPGLSFNTTTGKLSGTPTKAGSYRPLISATNGGGTGSANVALTVKPAKPEITSSLNPPARQGVAFVYQITATNSPTSYATSSIPPGLSFSTGTGKFTGTPTKAGTYKPLISATNAGGTASVNLMLVVKPPA